MEYPTVIINKARATAFGRKCKCVLCKPSKCGGDITHVALVRSDYVWICWICADEYHKYGFEVFEIIF